jgi:hypothetical protein
VLMKSPHHEFGILAEDNGREIKLVNRTKKAIDIQAIRLESTFNGKVVESLDRQVRIKIDPESNYVVSEPDAHEFLLKAREKCIAERYGAGEFRLAIIVTRDPKAIMQRAVFPAQWKTKGLEVRREPELCEIV